MWKAHGFCRKIDEIRLQTLDFPHFFFLFLYVYPRIYLTLAMMAGPFLLPQAMDPGL